VSTRTVVITVRVDCLEYAGCTEDSPDATLDVVIDALRSTRGDLPQTYTVECMGLKREIDED
jgi:hypothetical protein